MPAIITHHLFGEEAARRLPEALALAEEELLAFLLGNQGPDPFYFCFTAKPTTIQACHQLAEDMHARREADALVAARDAVAHLPAADQGVGRAFALGLVAHYLLDSEAHAFVGAQVEALCAAGEGLGGAQAQVHALIESELDTWMLWSMRQQTIDDSPAWADLARTERVTRVAGSLLSQVAWQVFDVSVGPEHYAGCLRDYELVYKAIDPTGNPRGRMLAGAERLGARFSLLDALSHTNTPPEDCPAANLACHSWHDALADQERTTSFPDIFYDSLELWPPLAEAFVRGDRKMLERLMQRSYAGGPLA